MGRKVEEKGMKKRKKKIKIQNKNENEKKMNESM